MLYTSPFSEFWLNKTWLSHIQQIQIYLVVPFIQFFHSYNVFIYCRSAQEALTQLWLYTHFQYNALIHYIQH